METAECWQLALERDDGPSVLALTRQNLPPVRTEFTEEPTSAAAAPTSLRRRDGDADVTIFATGSEVEIALAAKKLLDAARRHRARVVSVPCFELFAEQSEDYRAEIIGDGAGQGRDRGRASAWAGTGSSAPTASSSA